jgi:hypothetical protein
LRYELEKLAWCLDWVNSDGHHQWSGCGKEHREEGLLRAALAAPSKLLLDQYPSLVDGIMVMDQIHASDAKEVLVVRIQVCKCRKYQTAIQ